jgi:hypothetical protein
VAGIGGSTYEVTMSNIGQLNWVEGAEWTKGAATRPQFRIRIPSPASSGYVRAKIVFHFGGKPAPEIQKKSEN